MATKKSKKGKPPRKPFSEISSFQAVREANVGKNDEILLSLYNRISELQLQLEDITDNSPKSAYRKEALESDLDRVIQKKDNVLLVTSLGQALSQQRAEALEQNTGISQYKLRDISQTKDPEHLSISEHVKSLIFTAIHAPHELIQTQSLQAALA